MTAVSFPIAMGGVQLCESVPLGSLPRLLRLVELVRFVADFVLPASGLGESVTVLTGRHLLVRSGSLARRRDRPLVRVQYKCSLHRNQTRTASPMRPTHALLSSRMAAVGTTLRIQTRYPLFWKR